MVRSLRTAAVLLVPAVAFCYLLPLPAPLCCATACLDSAVLVLCVSGSFLYLPTCHCSLPAVWFCRSPTYFCHWFYLWILLVLDLAAVLVSGSLPAAVFYVLQAAVFSSLTSAANHRHLPAPFTWPHRTRLPRGFCLPACIRTAVLGTTAWFNLLPATPATGCRHHTRFYLRAAVIRGFCTCYCARLPGSPAAPAGSDGCCACAVLHCLRYLPGLHCLVSFGFLYLLSFCTGSPLPDACIPPYSAPFSFYWFSPACVRAVRSAVRSPVHHCTCTTNTHYLTVLAVAFCHLVHLPCFHCYRLPTTTGSAHHRNSCCCMTGSHWFWTLRFCVPAAVHSPRFLLRFLVLDLPHAAYWITGFCGCWLFTDRFLPPLAWFTTALRNTAPRTCAFCTPRTAPPPPARRLLLRFSGLLPPYFSCADTRFCAPFCAIKPACL